MVIRTTLPRPTESFLGNCGGYWTSLLPCDSVWVSIPKTWLLVIRPWLLSRVIRWKGDARAQITLGWRQRIQPFRLDRVLHDFEKHGVEGLDTSRIGKMGPSGTSVARQRYGKWLHWDMMMYVPKYLRSIRLPQFLTPLHIARFDILLTGRIAYLGVDCLCGQERRVLLLL